MSDPGPDEYPVPALLDGVRVDRAVAMLTGLPRARAAALVEDGRVRVDGRVAASRRAPLVAGTVLAIDAPPEAAGLQAEEDVRFRVVHEDDEVVVVDKPAGLVVHPGAGNARGTLVAGLLARYPELDAPGPWDPERPGIVHRLDRGTSGLLVVARTAGAYRSLVAQLAERAVSRRYLALAAGWPEADRGVVEAPIGRSGRTPTRMAVSAQGRPARTAYRVLARYDTPLSAALLVLDLDTGRTHQIRVHLAAIGHPVVGDDRYGAAGPHGEGGRVGGLLLPTGRLFLHAAELAFDHPGDGGRRRFGSPLPPDLAGLLPAEPPPLPPA